jgi:hypothetical protein
MNVKPEGINILFFLTLNISRYTRRNFVEVMGGNKFSSVDASLSKAFVRITK